MVCEEAPFLQMNTLDGEKIFWTFYATTNKNRKYYDTVNREHKSYKITTFKERQRKLEIEDEFEEFPQNRELDSRGMKRRFLSYFIHSIDASLLRRFIYLMKTKHKVSINHLHDCVILHPNHVDAFYEVVKEVYSCPKLYDIVFDGLFDSVSNNLSPESNVKLQEHRKKFIDSTSDFRNDIQNMKPEHMYSLED